MKNIHTHLAFANTDRHEKDNDYRATMFRDMTKENGKLAPSIDVTDLVNTGDLDHFDIQGLMTKCGFELSKVAKDSIISHYFNGLKTGKTEAMIDITKNALNYSVMHLDIEGGDAYDVIVLSSDNLYMEKCKGHSGEVSWGSPMRGLNILRDFLNETTPTREQTALGVLSHALYNYILKTGISKRVTIGESLLERDDLIKYSKLTYIYNRNFSKARMMLRRMPEVILSKNSNDVIPDESLAKLAATCVDDNASYAAFTKFIEEHIPHFTASVRSFGILQVPHESVIIRCYTCLCG